MKVFLENRKAWLMVLVAVLTYVYGALDEGMTPNEWVLTLSTLVGAFSVYVVDNLDTGIGHYAKAVVSFLMPALGVVAAQILDGLTPQEWIEAVIAGAAGVGLVAGVGNANYRFSTKARAGGVVSGP